MKFFQRLNLWKTQTEDKITSEPTEAPEEKRGECFYAPVTGQVKNITELSDPVYSKKEIGDGVHILPADNKIYAPADCAVAFIFPSRHALGLRTASGIELFIHIGLDTAKLKGKGFTLHVEEDQEVKRGTLLAEFDMELIKEQATPEIPVLVTNLTETQKLITEKKDNVSLEDILFEIV